MTPHPFDTTDLLDRPAVARLLGKTQKQVANMQARGQIPSPLKIPGVGVRWYAPAIAKWIAANPAPAARARLPPLTASTARTQGAA